MIKKFDSLSQTLLYYEWDDIQKYLSQELKIDPSRFRDVDGKYSKKGDINAPYRDWWHVWITLNLGDVSNDSYKDVWFDNLDFDTAKAEYGDWVLALKPIIENIQQQVNGDYITIHYSW